MSAEFRNEARADGERIAARSGHQLGAWTLVHEGTQTGLFHAECIHKGCAFYAYALEFKDVARCADCGTRTGPFMGADRGGRQLCIRCYEVDGNAV